MTKSIAEKPLVNIYIHHKQCFTSSLLQVVLPRQKSLSYHQFGLLMQTFPALLLEQRPAYARFSPVYCVLMYNPVHHHHSTCIKIHTQSQYKSTIALLQFKYKLHKGGQEAIVRVFCYLCLLVYNASYVMFCSAKEEEALRMPAERPEGCHHYTPCHVIIKPLEELQSDQQSDHFSFNT